MNDLERLVAAWVAWEQAPASPAAVAHKETVLRELGLSGRRTHAVIAAHRRAGWSIPDAAQAALLDQQGVRQ
jgi:hypothetical protein